GEEGLCWGTWVGNSWGERCPRLSWRPQTPACLIIPAKFLMARMARWRWRSGICARCAGRDGAHSASHVRRVELSDRAGGRGGGDRAHPAPFPEPWFPYSAHPRELIEGRGLTL